ncbi:unnamed protein product [Cylicostephanus goldi]|uniref:Uncharacterized protein n=1 Tax=Cylicostephanus goldi TaxID=71465 RepID=A0A3P6S5M2_CYLGO|nr:unnamed protein product [Cylicostephanus goldi]
MTPFVYVLLFLTANEVMAEKSKEEKCGLPSNIATLPDYAQVELRDLWKSYVEGEPCEKELIIQQDVLNVVNTFSKDLKGGSELFVMIFLTMYDL